MKNNPLQVVFNAQDYIHTPIVEPGGGLEDFYGGMDEEFKEHKKSLDRQISHIQELLLKGNEYINVVKVELNPSALAKSHRPMRTLFPSNKSPHIGGLNIGSLLFQVTPESLKWLRSKIESAELESRLVYDEFKKKMVYKPSSARSESGAIEKISLYDSSEKIQFSAEEAMEWLSCSQVSKGYLVELIEYVENNTKGYDVSKQKIVKLKADLTDKLLKLGSGVILSKASIDAKNNNFLYVRLYKGHAKNSIIDFDNVVINRGSFNELYDFDSFRHELLLKILVGSPLVKRISLPPMISRSDLNLSATQIDFSLPLRKLENDYPVVGIIDSGVKNSTLKKWMLGSSVGFVEDDCDPDHASQIASLLIGGKTLNPSLNNIEDDGCLIYDIWTPVHSERNSFFNYFDGFGDFFDWLDIEVKEARKLGVRIFNLSINFRELVKDDSYSFTANQIDRISKKYDVIFVVSAGNLNPIDYRAKWPSQHAITSDIDRIQQPPLWQDSCHYLVFNQLGR